MEHITMPRGDLRNVHFTVHDANDAEVSKGFTQITFTVKENTSSRKVIIQKKLTDGTITKDGNVYSFSIMPEDTDYIDFGTYYYDIESASKAKKEYATLNSKIDKHESSSDIHVTLTDKLKLRIKLNWIV